MERLLKGALAGAAATVPMTLAMKAMHANLPAHEQYPLPPREITEEITEKAGVDEHLDEEDQTALTYINHFGYGAATGAVYAGVVSRIVKPSVTSGIAYGLAVWLASYQELLPALGILRPATEHPTRRNALMIAAHVVWGASLGMSVKKLTEK